MAKTAVITFTDPTELDNWVIINDTVMGGRSVAHIEPTPTGTRFSGLLSLENNGGFASIRRIPEPLGLSSNKAIELTVQGDGRTYQFRLRTNRQLDGVAYVATFATPPEATTVVQFTTKDFTPQWRGRIVTNAAPLAFEDVQQLGFMLADKTPGHFALNIMSIAQTNTVDIANKTDS
ncbi:CIA30 family protein [Alteromonas sp. ASW11-36]|uniref:CIA30 family protein n=1 Tax=Alteromonas arenosi TaxID=3055817 RepID=A0ABT7SZF7_9ALTE|nr:CIA30 family protein [Alteromonas sp. ASW11-36]MDM7861578.1 CIA30 family protein [Alteromonas sp. ASW11-36]